MTEEVETKTRGRAQRKKVYQRIRETQIPKELIEHFKKNNYDLRLVRWSISGSEDLRYLYTREQEGYEFVDTKEVPEHILRSMQVLDTKAHAGMITMGDLCLMKIDSDLRNSRREVFQQEAEREIAAVDMHVLEKKGLRNLGSSSKVYSKEPSFQD